MRTNKAIITHQELVELRFANDLTFTYLLIKKGFEHTGGPILPTLKGTITKTEDDCSMCYRYEQRIDD